TCVDGVLNGTESDVDCGGTCTKCGAGHHCTAGADCISQSCADTSSGGTAGKTCQCPHNMTSVPTPGPGSYCIDATEVTYSQYQIFINQNPATGNQPAFCAWNNTYIPQDNWPVVPSQAALPIRSVDWCDAYAYCKSVNKHLCGKIGGGSN